uniref:Apolipoprotein L5-like n=1 Tax=Pogona vitticeps TaxID=103695 RepID=A0A6J0T7M5_9SAUR
MEDEYEYIVYFLQTFPAQKEEIEKCIRCLQEVADSIDKIHKNCTIASLTANSTSASSGVLSVVGLFLAPVTAGGSLILTATGIGLGAAAAVTGLSATLYESVSSSKEIQKAQELMNVCEKSLRKALLPDEIDFNLEPALGNGAMGENIKQLVSNIAGQAPDMCKTVKRIKSVKGIRTNIKAWQVARNNPGLKALAKRMTAGGSTSQSTIWGANRVNKAFAGTTLAMTKGSRMLSAASAGVFLLFDAYSIVQDAKCLTEGAKAETAAEIRKKASQLEKELYHLQKLYGEFKDLV